MSALHAIAADGLSHSILGKLAAVLSAQGGQVIAFEGLGSDRFAFKPLSVADQHTRVHQLVAADSPRFAYKNSGSDRSWSTTEKTIKAGMDLP